MTARPNGSPLSGRYFVRNPAWNLALRAVDLFVRRTQGPGASKRRQPIERILIATGGHLGDAVIATSVLPELVRAFPHAQIGMLLPTWSRAVVEGHPRIQWLHHADHWKMNRTANSPKKWLRHRATSRRAIDEIVNVGYDLAIDLYAYYPNSARLLAKAGIPCRVGFTSGGCGPLYTTPVDWRADLGHTAEQHRFLLKKIGCEVVGDPAYDLPPLSPQAIDRARQFVSGEYVVVHPGTGDARKAWPLEHWRETVAALTRAGEQVVITGRGSTEKQVASDLAFENANVVNLADRLDWPTFRAVIAGAATLIAPDSVAGHLAAAAGVPTIVISAALSDPAYWRPLGPHVTVLTHSVPCAPCFRSRGCAGMECVRGVSVAQVLERFEDMRVVAPRAQS